MKIDRFSFGSITIDGKEYERDVVIADGSIHQRNNGPSKAYRDQFGHTPLSSGEAIPWDCDRLVIGTGAHGRLPVMDEVKSEAQRRAVELVILPTEQAIKAFEASEPHTNAIFHITC